VARSNPYAPPASDDEAPESDDARERRGKARRPPKYKLYSPRHLGIAAFLGAPLGGMIIHAINLHRRGRREAVTNAVLAGVALTVAMIVLGFLLPDAVGRVSPSPAQSPWSSGPSARSRPSRRT
jgi:hypothetical protein